jgi:RimJ/RimL family protein N-acetyltransferase
MVLGAQAPGRVGRRPVFVGGPRSGPPAVYALTVELRDDLLVLRRFTGEDAPAIAAACADPDIGRFIPGIPDPYTDADARSYLLKAGADWQDGTRRAFAVVDAESGRLLGAVDVGLGDVGSIGYWTTPDARGRGVATRALQLLSRWALVEGGVERLELMTHPENHASQRVAEKAGFVREGVLRSHLRFSEGRRDAVLFSLVPSDLE